jgi:hypothetical protein
VTRGTKFEEIGRERKFRQSMKNVTVVTDRLRHLEQIPARQLHRTYPVKLEA